MSRRYVYEVTVEPADDMGLDNYEQVMDVLEEAIRDSGMDNAANIKVRLTHLDEGEDDAGNGL